MNAIVHICEEVREALATGGSVVALESTIFSSLGLPAPDNERVLHDCLEAVRAAGATPAVCAVVDGVAEVGTMAYDRVLGATLKLGERDLPHAVATGATGVTTVSATVALAAIAGIDVFATGGIGGVHRGAEITGDISADLPAIARHPVLTVSAGVKGFLDVGRTVEYLETLGVPVLGWQTDVFPAFWCRTSDHRVGSRVDDTAAAAAVVHAARTLGGTGLLLVVPCPEDAALARDEIDPVIEAALAASVSAGVVGGAVTPFVLEHIRAATAGRSIVANRALAVRNAQIGAQVAVAIRDRHRRS